MHTKNQFQLIWMMNWARIRLFEPISHCRTRSCWNQFDSCGGAEGGRDDAAGGGGGATQMAGGSPADWTAWGPCNASPADGCCTPCRHCSAAVRRDAAVVRLPVGSAWDRGPSSHSSVPSTGRWWCTPRRCTLPSNCNTRTTERTWSQWIWSAWSCSGSLYRRGTCQGNASKMSTVAGQRTRANICTECELLWKGNRE